MNAFLWDGGRGVGWGGGGGHTDQDLDPSAVSTAETTERQETRPAVLISLCVVSQQQQQPQINEISGSSATFTCEEELA